MGWDGMGGMYLDWDWAGKGGRVMSNVYDDDYDYDGDDLERKIILYVA